MLGASLKMAGHVPASLQGNQWDEGVGRNIGFHKCETMPQKDKTIFLSFGNLCPRGNSHIPR